MKKFLMTLVAAFAVAMSANAQVYVGGGFGINGVDNGNTTVTTYKFIPEVGYNFNENWAAGVAFGWEGASKGGTKTLEVNPYARFTFVHTKYVNLFVDGGFGYKHTYNNRNDADLWAVGARPGVAVKPHKETFVCFSCRFPWLVTGQGQQQQFEDKQVRS